MTITLVARRILFGRFLDFMPSGHNGTKPPRNLTERRGSFLAFATTGCNVQKPPRNLTERRGATRILRRLRRAFDAVDVVLMVVALALFFALAWVLERR